ncbi:hypothetical protein JD844_000961 [Phrynosoma platyrhinos]|uniref:Rad21/Rec8-like protein C-terminal eukaryotic domain-containing protein n=1 Tax=Phrynosoma platyrhinos TaxID=52577 RepID=A0ABQ7T8U0_PHRPL|nr:hypothetical protein JD844_000961 [Phrynosoma platyrhinos]
MSHKPEEIQHILERLHRAQQQIRIDLTDLEQPGLLLPNQLALMEALEEAPDPFFGMMEPLLPSPEAIPYVRHILEAPTPEKSPLEPSPPSLQRRQAGKPHITVSPEAITLKEAEPITLLTIEGEQDLPEITGQEIDMLVEQEGFLVAPGEEEPFRLPGVSPRKRHAEEESAEKVRQQEPFVSLGLSPPTRIGEEPSAARDTGLALTEEILLPGEAPLPPLEMTPLPEGPRMPPSPRSPLISPGLERPPPPSPELLLPEYEPSPTRPRRRRRRQLRFLDDVTQISREEFQEQIADIQTQCQPLKMVLLPAKRRKMPAELMGTATYGWMHPTLQDLWSRQAKLQRVDYARQRALEEQAQRVEEEEMAQKPEVPSELEELRAAEEPSVPPMASSEISLETTEEEQRPSLVIPEERILLEEPEEVPLAVVPELPEISFELPLDKDMITLDYVRRLVSAKLEQIGEIDFDHLVPLTTSRLVVSLLAATKHVRLEQTEPYGQIVIQPGAHFRLS